MSGVIGMETTEEKTYSKWEWFLYIILLPTLFTLILVGIILTFMKVDVITPILEVANKIPYVEKVIPDPKKEPEDDFILYENTFQNKSDSSTNTEELAQLLAQESEKYQQEINDKESIILELESELAATDSRIENLESEINKLLLEEQEAASIEQIKKNKEIAQMYSAMTASKAAPILSNMENDEVVQILSEMDSKKMSQILAKMDPQKAAELTVLLKQINTEDIASDEALQARILELEEQLKVAKDAKSETQSDLLEIVKSFEVMDPTAAAGIIEKMWTDKNNKQALAILKNLGSQPRSRILANMGKETAALVTSELTK